jgi:hypothetical protein
MTPAQRSAARIAVRTIVMLLRARSARVVLIRIRQLTLCARVFWKSGQPNTEYKS